ncbi:MAG: succinate dehydrogenase cytochrome b subunit [Elusimicrobia bacterium]|nr:succinate dehydrogenase cytochrome b subunit [Elusimicrobiota bacterium]
MIALMNALIRYATSSIGKKQIVGLTGLMLCGFLAGHLAGNFLLYKGEGVFNAYAQFLTSNPLLPYIELALLGVFMTHIGFALWVTWEDLLARPERYAVRRNAGGRTIGSSTMIYTGALTLAFLLFHVTVFKLSGEAEQHVRGLFGVVIDCFKSGAWVAFYAAALLGLGVHLSHGVQSAFQTFGVNHEKLTPGIKAAGLLFAAAMAVCFGMIPVLTKMGRIG